MNKTEKLFFRVKTNGASVYRVDTASRQNRLAMQQIANVNVRNGEIKPQGDMPPTAAERNEIDAWVVSRRKRLSARTVDDIFRTVDHLNMTAQWVQSQATDAQLDEFAEELLMAMHDLRSVIIRKKSDRFS